MREREPVPTVSLVTVVMGIVVGLTFLFGNVLALGLRLGILDRNPEK